MHIRSKRQNNFFGICGRCKIDCCRNARPPITRERRRIIETFLKKRKIPVDNPFVETSHTFPREDAKGYCMFYDRKTRKCQIHPAKPETCVAGPITFDINMQNQKIEWYLKMEKICPLAGVIYEKGEILKKHLESAKKEIFRLVRELNPEALRAILKIEEPETFKMCEDDIGKDILDKLTSDS